MNPREIYYLYDDPIPFRDDLKIYPVSMRDYYKFFFYAQCLQLEKNSLRDPMEAMKAISMSYLEYLYYVCDPEATNEKNTVALLEGLFRLTFRLPEESKTNYGYTDDNKPVFSINDKLYDSSDFDLFKEIVSEQNELKLPDETIQKDVRDAIEEARRVKAKLEGREMAGLEDQIIALSIFTGWELSRIYDLSIRKFARSLLRANHMLYQNYYHEAEFSGMVSFNDKSVLKGWLAKIDDSGGDSDVTMDADRLENKVNMNEAMGKQAGK